MSTFISQRLRELEKQRHYELEKEALSLAPITKAWQSFKGWRASRAAAADAAKNSGFFGTLRKWRTPEATYKDGPMKGSTIRDAFGKPIQAKDPSLVKSIGQSLGGGTRTRYDQLFNRGLAKEHKASQKGVGFLDRKSLDEWLQQLDAKQRKVMMDKIKQEVTPQASMSKMEFLKHNKPEALRWYGKQLAWKGMTYGMPAYDVYDAATDPNRSAGEALGSSAGSILGMGITGKAGMVPGLIGAMGGSMGGGILGAKAESVLRGQKQVPPPQFVPPPTLHAYQPQQPYQNPYGQG